MGLFTRKRTPLYIWNDEWEPYFLEAQVDSHATTFHWIHPDDFHSQLIGLSWDFWEEGIKHTIQEWWNITDGDRNIFNFGFRITNQLGLHNNALSVISYATYSQYPDSKSYGPIPEHCYMLPGQQIRYNLSGNIGGDELRAVRLYFKRWMMR